MDLGLKEKVAVVTGSSRGIGRGIALGLALEGCRIVLCARNQVDLMKAEEAVRARNVETLALPLDITKPGSELQLVESTLRKFGRIDILVNNAGGNRRGRFEATTDVDWKEIIDLNLLSHVRISRAVVPHMRKQGEGVILFMASVFGRESGGPNLSIYNTTKSGIISLAKIMAVELAPHGIRVNSVAPGSIRFPGGSWDGRAREDPEAIAGFVERELPLGRFGTVEEVADVVVFLASKRAGLITGACISVDGCQSHCLI
jgi:3-oxoacyl-[acyl-carrier protein] reductase